MVGSMAGLGAVGATVNMVYDAFWNDFFWMAGMKLLGLLFLWEFCNAIKGKVCLVSFLVMIVCTRY